MSSAIHYNLTEVQKRLSEHLVAQLALCDSLEKIADDLPDNYDNQECLHVSARIYATIKSAHKFEEEELFPVLKLMHDHNDIDETLQQLHSDHWEDESYAYELQGALYSLITEPEKANKTALAYMLRGFFDNLRRHIAVEKQFFFGTLRTFAEANNLQKDLLV